MYVTHTYAYSLHINKYTIPSPSVEVQFLCQASITRQLHPDYEFKRGIRILPAYWIASAFLLPLLDNTGLLTSELYPQPWSRQCSQ